MKIKDRLLAPAFAALALCLLPSCTGPFVSVFPLEPEETPVRHFVLSSETRTLDAGTALRPVTFSRITIPAYLDVPQIVTSDGNTVRRHEKNRWGEPLARGAARVLELKTLAALAGTPAPKIRRSVRVAIGRLDGSLGGNVEISAFYTLTPESDQLEDADSVSRLFRASVKVEPPNDCGAYVNAVDAALDLLAENIAASLRE